jgi:hypothetical protein
MISELEDYQTTTIGSAPLAQGRPTARVKDACRPCRRRVHLSDVNEWKIELFANFSLVRSAAWRPAKSM